MTRDEAMFVQLLFLKLFEQIIVGQLKTVSFSGSTADVRTTTAGDRLSTAKYCER